MMVLGFFIVISCDRYDYYSTASADLPISRGQNREYPEDRFALSGFYRSNINIPRKYPAKSVDFIKSIIYTSYTITANECQDKMLHQV